ncbi:nuclear condensing complex subunit [Chytriomyces sp. MP71]|nr:nuclear condensing complex subunit [Chytriomyces sp. MP71]
MPPYSNRKKHSNFRQQSKKRLAFHRQTFHPTQEKIDLFCDEVEARDRGLQVDARHPILKNNSLLQEKDQEVEDLLDSLKILQPVLEQGREGTSVADAIARQYASLWLLLDLCTNADQVELQLESCNFRTKESDMELSELERTMAEVFCEASRDGAAHGRLAKTLLKLQKAGETVGGVGSGKEAWLVGFWRCLLHVLATKRVARDAAQKALRFVECVVASAGLEKGKSKLAVSQQNIVSFLLTRLSKGAAAKQAHVRFRVCQMLFLLLNHVSEIDDDMHSLLKTVLIQRSRDKDAHVRVQASMALTRFQGTPDDMDEQVIEVLVDLMTGDSSADVRKSLVWNTDLNSLTLLPLLQRANDVDAGVRRLVYQRFACVAPDMLELPIEVRIALLGVGLKDRDEGVRKRCKKMLCDAWWKSQNWSILEFLKELDVRTVAAEEGLIALLDQNCIKLDFVTDAMWADEISIEFIFFAYIYTRTLNKEKAEEAIQDFLPPLTAMSQLLQNYSAMILSQLSNDLETIRVVEFVLTRLLQMTLFYDFSDEMGRRTVSTIVADAVCDIQDSIESEDSIAEEMEPHMRELLLQMQCLEIIRASLEQIQRPPRADPSFQCLIHKFIVPSVRSENGLLRQTGLHCLGLACYVDKDLPLDNLQLFLHAFQAEQSNADIKKLVLQIIFDLVMVHGVTMLAYVIKYSLEQEDVGVLTLAVEGATKLMMMRVLADAEILEALLVLYFHPQTKNEFRLRQCLTCFFPMYALSSSENQMRIVQVVVAAFSSLALAYEESQQGLPPMDIAAQLIEWTDYRRLSRTQKTTDEEDNATKVSAHGIFSIKMLEIMLVEPDLQRDGTKVLNALFIDSSIADAERKRILKLADDMLMVDPTSLKGIKRFVGKVQDTNDKKADEDSEDSDD